MKIEEHVFACIDASDRGEIEHALLHACIAIDGSAQKYYEKDHSSRRDYTAFIRKYYWILEPMTVAGINFDETRWDNVDLKDRNGKPIENKDIASFIYHIFRCNQAHGKEIPQHYKLLKRDADGRLSYHIAENTLRIPETIIWGLIAICVFSKVNKNIVTKTSHYLTLGENHFSISDWWGLEDAFQPIAKKYNKTRVTLQGL